MAKVLIAAPTYDGWRSEGNCVSLLRVPSDCRHEVHVRTSTSSLLCAGFNDSVCAALNDRDEIGLEYFGMLHSDVSPESYWLDKLIDILLDYGLDVVSCVIPIKSGNRQTSTAVAVSRDIFEDVRVLGSNDVYNLPIVFRSTDAIRYLNEKKEAMPIPEDMPLLVNTGCFVSKISAIEGLCFTIQDKIVRTETGKWETRVAPEDWNMSRDWHERGLKVAATRAVAISHLGNWAFTL